MRCMPFMALCAICLTALPAVEVNFKPEKDIAAGTVSGVSSMDVAPINNDAYADVLVVEGGKHAGGRKTFAWFESPADPQGTWIRRAINDAAPLRSFLGAAKLADFDGDGDFDIAVSSDNHSGGSKQADVFVFVNPGAAATATWSYYTCNASTLPLHHINDMVIADIDDDGKLDIVTRSLDPNQIQIFFQNNISSWTLKTVDTGIASSEGLSVGDINGDRYPDITFSGWWLQTPSNARSGNYAKKPIDSNYQNTNQNTKEDVADIDGDGLADIVIGPAESYRNGANHILAWYKNPGSGYNSNWQRFVIRSNTNHHHTIRLADIDSDGDNDIITGKPWSSSGIPREVLIFYNNGSGDFSQVQQVVNGKGLYSGVVYDIGNDGDLDIIGQNVYAGSSKPYLYESELNDDGGPQPDTQAPSQPGNISAHAMSSTAVQLSWSASNDNIAVTAYEISRDGSIIHTQSGTTYLDNGLQSQTTYTYTVRARDAAGNWSSTAGTTATTLAEPVNQAPLAVVSASPENGNVDLEVQFDARASSDEDGYITQYAWDFGDGAIGNGATISHTYTTSGIFVATLTVTDNAGAHASTTVPITVTDPAPNIRDAYTRIEAESFDAMQGIGIYNGGSGQKIGSIENGTWAMWKDVDFADGAMGFSASVSSRFKVGTITIHLDAIDGPIIGSCEVPVTGNWNTFVDIQCSVSNAAGIHDVYFAFSGGSGALLDVDYFVFHQDVAPQPNQSPQAVFSVNPQSGEAPVSVNVNASASSDSDGIIQSYHWNFGDGQTASGVTSSHTYTHAGTYTITLTVTDDDAATALSSNTVVVTAAPPSDVRNAFTRIEAESFDAMESIGIYSGGSGQKIGSIENGRWACYEQVDFSSGAAHFYASVSSETIGGTFELRLDALDGQLIGTCHLPGTGDWNNFVDVDCAISNALGVHDLYIVFYGSARFVGDVDYFIFSQEMNPPPVNQNPVAAFQATPENGEAPVLVSVDASAAHDPDGQIQTYAWDFGDGHTTSGVQASHTYNHAGTYTISLTVTDNEGASAVQTTVVTVTAAPPPAQTRNAFARIEAETFDAMLSIGIYPGGTGQKIGSIENGRWAKYNAVDFAQGAHGFHASVSSNTVGGEIEIRLDALDGPLVGVCSLPGTGSWEHWLDVQCAINGADGIHDVYLVFSGTANFVGDVDYFSFEQDAPPAANEIPTAISAADIQDAEAPAMIQFDGSASYDRDGSIILYAWDFADGATASGAQVTHQFTSAGTYLVQLTVTDNAGASASDQIQITITDALPPNQGDGAIAHWTFDEQEGQLAADSAGNYPATLANGAELNVSGWFQSALQCDGVDDYADAGPIDVSGTAMSVAAWIKADRLDAMFAEGRIISQANGTSSADHIFMLSPYPKNGGGIGVRFRLQINGSTKTLVANGGSIQTGLWTHVAAVFDGHSMYVYQDGEQVGSMSVIGTITGSDSIPVWIGGNPSGATERPFAGCIDDVRLYDRALPVEEIMTLADVNSANG